MSLKIGLISDVHANPAPLQEALTLFRREGIDTILCAGDVAGYGTELERTVQLLIDSDCRVILGNHDLWYLSRSDERAAGPVADYLRALPRVVELSAGGKQLCMVHASPPDSLVDGIRLLDVNGQMVQAQKDDWTDSLRDFPADVLVVGHTHQVFAERLGHVLVINPGSTIFNHTCAVLSLPAMEVEVVALAGKRPQMAWNWGMERPAG